VTSNVQLCFENQVLDLTRRELLRDGQTIRVEPKIFDLLVYLVENRDRLITKDDLIAKVWAGRIVSESALASAINAARKAVGDSGQEQRLIRTRARKGFRFVGTITSNGASTPMVLPDKPSIAVLPFQNMSGDPNQEYFADGIAEDLITALSRGSWFFVIARNSSFAFRAEKLDVRTIAQRLGVRYLVEGSVRKIGSRLRVTAQLIDAASGTHLWADKYDGSLDEMFELQDRIIENLMGAIEPKLRSAEIARTRRKRSENLDAFDLLLQALPNHWAMSCQGFGRAIELLDRAIALAPGYAEALGYAAACRAFRPLHNCSPDPAKDFEEADRLSWRALEADPLDPVALRSASFVSVLTKRDYETALNLIDRSLAVDPNGALTWGYRGWINVWAGHPDEAIADCDKALRLSPFDHWISTHTLGKSFALTMSGRFEDGLRWARRAMQENPQWTASYRGLAAALVLNGKVDEARPVAARLWEIDPDFSVERWSETAPFRRTEGQEVFFSALRTAGLPK
jgi:TolB-like protein